MSLARFMHTHTHTHTHFHLDKPRVKKVFNHHSAVATVTELRHHVWQASYTGVMSPATFDVLRAKVIHATVKANILVVHMERALIAIGEPPPIPLNTYRMNCAPAAIVVRADQHQLWSDYAENMATIGIMRLIFLEHQQDQVQRFVACLTGDQAVAEYLKHAATPSA